MVEITSLGKAEKTAASVLKKNQDARRLAYRLFNTIDGIVVYDWLMNQFYHNQHTDTDFGKLARQAGRRDVMVMLRNAVENET